MCTHHVTPAWQSTQTKHEPKLLLHFPHICSASHRLAIINWSTRNLASIVTPGSHSAPVSAVPALFATVRARHGPLRPVKPAPSTGWGRFSRDGTGRDALGRSQTPEQRWRVRWGPGAGVVRARSHRRPLRWPYTRWRRREGRSADQCRVPTSAAAGPAGRRAPPKPCRSRT